AVEAVVPARGTFCADADRAEGQGYIVADYQQALDGYSVVAQESAHRATAVVHEGERFRQDYLAARNGAASHLRVRLALFGEAQAMARGEEVGYHITGVVARVCKACAGVAEAHYQVLALIGAGVLHGFPLYLRWESRFARGYCYLFS